MSDEECAIVGPSQPTKGEGLKRVDDRRGIDGVLGRSRKGAPAAQLANVVRGRDVPERRGLRTTLCDRFDRRRAAGVWNDVLGAVSAACAGEVVTAAPGCGRIHQHGAAAERGA